MTERRTDELPLALERMEAIAERAIGRRVMVFLDYDGTLTPIVERPEDAVLDAAMRERVRGLARVSTVAVVSGRALRDVRERVGLPEIVYAGSHGFKIAGPAGTEMTHQAGQQALPQIDAAERELQRALAPIAGAQVERKELSVAVHYRRVAGPEVPRVERVVQEVLAHHDGLKRSAGKKVFELQPDIDWNKGRALRWLLQELVDEPADVFSVYIGDDITDEDAFAALQAEDVGVVVRDADEPRLTRATYAVDSPEQVGQLLERLTAAVQEMGA